MDPGKKKFERLIFPTKYVIPKSLKVSHWPSKCINLKHPYIIYNYLSFWSRLFVSNTTIQWVDVCHDIVAYIRWTHPRMIPGCYVCFTQGTWPSFPKNNGGPSWLYKLLTYPHLQSTYSNILFFGCEVMMISYSGGHSTIFQPHHFFGNIENDLIGCECEVPDPLPFQLLLLDL